MNGYFDSPIGWLELTVTHNFLEEIRFLENKPNLLFQTKNDLIRKVSEQLNEYFNGRRRKFTIPLKPKGTDFQQRLWNELQNIPYGQTKTYGEIAKILGDIKKVRAVGKANGSNPIPIIIPCHRVIGTDNRLTGYAGGIHRKRYLLQHEGAILL